MKRNTKTNKRVTKRIISDKRIALRLSGENKFILQKAAKLSGIRSTSSFIITVAVNSASQLIEEHDGILTTERSRKIFFSALENPCSPNPALIAALKKYKEIVPYP